MVRKYCSSDSRKWTAHWLPKVHHKKFIMVVKRLKSCLLNVILMNLDRVVSEA
jgi:hypothetical protein